MTGVSDFTGVQAVTATIRQILQQRMEEPVPVTTAPPDVEVPNVDRPLANLFLYMVEESATLKNQDLPGMAGPMSLGQPPLSLNLHYLVTAAGPDPNDDRGGHRVLGDVMLTLHEHPIVAKDDPLLDPVLQNEVELLKITMEPLDVEGLSKIWTATTAALRLSVGYKVTVVQLESTQPRSVAKPVKELPRSWTSGVCRVAQSAGDCHPRSDATSPRPHSRGADSSLRAGRGAAARGGFGLLRWDETDSR